MHRGVLAVAAVVALWTLPAFAQTATVPQDVFLTTQGDGQYLAKDLLLGAKVHNAEGAIVGDVEDLILNADNQVQGVIMGIGGFAGWGEKRVGVTLSALQIKNENGIVTVTLPQATKETLERLPPSSARRRPSRLSTAPSRRPRSSPTRAPSRRRKPTTRPSPRWKRPTRT